ncbi:hypothetical protein BX659_1415 [Orenia metallireducens]|jgi:hypothetical protein|uniref:Uncharacterized protein n=1 Tax=Orenia metallireducens TaxID=1413210 RepID=A0A285IEK7_9FIRM|nr:hypothetical protein [Orenia metallireducens]PRX18814.1 hypothetical protein BX659_1415 [Orenia metallireducens]SNY46410.1 hypothetical protein SAMN06265827_1425 [Orenia metallireducens]
MGDSNFVSLDESEDIAAVEGSESGLDRLSEGDTDKIEKDYIHLQGRVSYGGKSKVHVLFIVIIGVESRKLINFEATVSNRDDILYVPTDNKGFLRIISKTSEEEKKKGRMIRAKLKEQLAEEDIIEFINLFGADEIEEINDRFKARLGDIVKEHVETSLFMELKDYEELKERYPHLFYDDNQDEEVDEGEIIIDCLPQISAVHGKRIGELEKGDIILVRLSELDYRNFSEKLSDMIVDQDKLEVRIEEIYFDDKKKIYYLLLDLGEDIKGRLIVESESELKLAVPKLRAKEIAKQSSYKSTNSQGLILYSFVFISILAIITIVLFYYI